MSLAASGPRQGRRPWSLRTRLVVAVLVMSAGALAAAGAAVTATLRSYLLARVDAQLRNAADGMLHRLTPGAGSGTYGSSGGVSPGASGRGGRTDAGSAGGELDDGSGASGGGALDRLPSPFVVEILDASGAPVAAPSSRPLDENWGAPTLPSLTLAQAEALSGRPFSYSTSAASGSSRRWRVLACVLPWQQTMIVAQGLDDVDATMLRLVFLEATVGVAALVLLSGMSALLIRRSLLPLRQVEQAALEITAGDRSRRAPDLDPRTEVGALATAFNSMIERVDGALDERLRAQTAAEASAERMRRFVADASHELRTPLTTIGGFAQLYRQVGAGKHPVTDELMDRIEQAGARMTALVEELLLLARLDQRVPLALAPVDLLDLASDCLIDARAAAPDHTWALQAVDSPAALAVLGDRGQLRRVVANLLANAARHTPAGTRVTIRVGEAVRDATTRVCVLEITDNGPGMAPEVAQRVFERFYRGDPSRARADGGGSGLGLAIAAELVQAHRGRLSVTTVPGTGTTFRVDLPALSG